jgi:hypothetical protein
MASSSAEQRAQDLQLGGVKDLLEALEPGIGTGALGELEELGHVRLPAGIDGGLLHRSLRRFEVLGLEIADQRPVLARRLPSGPLRFRSPSLASAPYPVPC